MIISCAVQFCSYFYPSTSPPSNPSLGAKLFAIFIIIKPIASIARPSKSSGEQNTYLAVHYVALHSPKFSACFYCLNLAENFAKYGMLVAITRMPLTVSKPLEFLILVQLSEQELFPLCPNHLVENRHPLILLVYLVLVQKVYSLCSMWALKLVPYSSIKRGRL